MWPETRPQRCWVHKFANVLAALPKSQHPSARMLAEIRDVEDSEHAVRAADAFAHELGAKWPKAVAKIVDDLDVLLTFFSWDSSLRRAAGRNGGWLIICRRGCSSVESAAWCFTIAASMSAAGRFNRASTARRDDEPLQRKGFVMRGQRVFVAAVLGSVIAWGGAAPASAAGGCAVGSVVTYTPNAGSGTAFGIGQGPGGTWYAHGGTINRINGTHVDEFAVPDGDTASAGWVAWDGASDRVWFTERGNGRIGSVDNAGAVRDFQVPDAGSPASPNGLVLGPATQVWFTDPVNSRIGMLDTATGAFTFYATPTPDSWPLGLTRGPDGALYFTERVAAQVGRLAADGTFTEWPLTPGASPNRIITGPDGAIWFTELRAGRLGRLDMAGHLSETPLDGGPVGITIGPDGAVYVALWFTGQVARLAADGSVDRSWTVPGGALLVGTSRDSVWATNTFTDTVNRVRVSCGT